MKSLTIDAYKVGGGNEDFWEIILEPLHDHPTLEHLNIESLGGGKFGRMSERFSSIHLQSLNVYNAFSTWSLEDCKSFAKALLFIPSLKELELEEIRFGMGDFKWVANSLKSHPSIQDLEFECKLIGIW